jgi:hypothetical protein
MLTYPYPSPVASRAVDDILTSCAYGIRPTADDNGTLIGSGTAAGWNAVCQPFNVLVGTKPPTYWLRRLDLKLSYPYVTTAGDKMVYASLRMFIAPFDSAATPTLIQFSAADAITIALTPDAETPYANNSTSVYTFDLGNLAWTPTAGKRYAVGFYWQKVAGASTPTMDGSTGTNLNVLCYKWNDLAAAPTGDMTLAGSTGATYAAHFELFFDTNAKKLFSIGTAAAPALAAAATSARIIIPRPLNKNWLVIYRGVTVGTDGKSLGMHLTNRDLTSATAAELAAPLVKVLMDFGDTEQMSFAKAGVGDASIALNAGTSEVADYFDVALNVKPYPILQDKTQAHDVELFWQNRHTAQGAVGTLDFITVCHGSQRVGTDAHGAVFVLGALTPAYVCLLPSAAGPIVETVEVCVDPLVLLGDSQTSYAAAGAAPGDPPYRLGTALPQAFSRVRSYWMGAVTSTRLNSNTGVNQSRISAYKNATPGLGDLCDLRGVTFALCGVGINDFSLMLDDTVLQDARAVVGAAETALDTVLTDIYANGNDAIIIGLPYCGQTIALDADTIFADLRYRAMNRAVRMMNAMYQRLARKYGCPFYDPYTVTQANSTVATWMHTDLLHYAVDVSAGVTAAAGPIAVVASVVAAVEANAVTVAS